MQTFANHKEEIESEPAENEAANGPLTMYDTSDIAFEPSGNAPYIELGAPAYDKGLADRRRT